MEETLRNSIESIEAICGEGGLGEWVNVSTEEVEDMLDEVRRLELAAEPRAARSLVEAVLRLVPTDARAWAAWRRLVAQGPPGEP